MKVPLYSYHELSPGAVAECFPPRRADSHKGNYGRVLLLCGSRGMAGCAVLAARAALRMGSGIVYLGVPESIYVIAASQLREAVVFPLPETADGRFSANAVPLILKRLENMDALLIGPGLGVSEELRALIAELLHSYSGPVVLDADGINNLAGHEELLKTAEGSLILTPHDGEFARVYKEPLKDRYEEAVRFAKEYHCILLRKGRHTLITDGTTVYRNQTGNPGMAKGGSGDVLSGIILSLAGRKLPPLLAAAAGAWVHGRAGDIACSLQGEYSMLPSDLIECIPDALIHL